MNEYLRKLNTGADRDDLLPMWREEGDILITPEGYRWRIERAPTVGELLHVGDVIEGRYGGGLVIKLHRYPVCCCPHRKTSSVLFCCPSWDKPKQTLKYHREVSIWSLVYIRPGSRQTKAGKFSESDYRYINEIVAVGNRLLKLYEANEEEIFVTNERLNIRPMQLEMFQQE